MKKLKVWALVVICCLYDIQQDVKTELLRLFRWKSPRKRKMCEYSSFPLVFSLQPCKYSARVCLYVFLTDLLARTTVYTDRQCAEG